MKTMRTLLKRVVRPERFELPTLWFEVRGDRFPLLI